MDRVCSRSRPAKVCNMIFQRPGKDSNTWMTWKLCAMALWEMLLSMTLFAFSHCYSVYMTQNSGVRMKNSENEENISREKENGQTSVNQIN